MKNMTTDIARKEVYEIVASIAAQEKFNVNYNSLEKILIEHGVEPICNHSGCLSGEAATAINTAKFDKKRVWVPGGAPALGSHCKCRWKYTMGLMISIPQ